MNLMRKDKLRFLIVLGVFIALSGIFSNTTTNSGSLHNEENGINEIIPPKISYYNNTENPIFINGSATGVGAHNWTWAGNQDWCRGSGAQGDPYIIENLTIDCGDVGAAISIVDSNSGVYFKIQNCTLTKSGSNDGDAGVYLSNTHNGTIINNNITLNGKNGINFDEGNAYYNVFKNNLSNNNQDGIYIEDSIYLEIWNNTLSNNGDSGVWAKNGLYNSTFAYNNASFNEYGLYFGDDSSIGSSDIIGNNVSDLFQ